jgi:hypothetical protein
MGVEGVHGVSGYLFEHKEKQKGVILVLGRVYLFLLCRAR